MTSSYTQISQYLSSPRRYRHRYLDGWREKDTRAKMLFGRVFEQALGALFLRQDPGAVLFRGWSTHQNSQIEYSHNDNWEHMLRQGIQLLERFVHDDRIRIQQPERNLQVKFTRPVSGKNDFVAYVDAIGRLDGERCLLEWKTSSSRYPEEPNGLLSLDPQLVCYSWMTGISNVAHVVFVRKRLVEIQYLRTTITDEQRDDFGHLVENTIGLIESGSFLPRSGIRFPQNPCTSCCYVGLRLGREKWSKPCLCDGQEAPLVCLMSLRTRTPTMPPQLDRQRALFVVAKIEEILAWEQRHYSERDSKFVESGRYLCEVRAGQYWRLENLKSFDEFLERRFPESRRKAYYLMSIHEQLPPQARKGLREVGWTKGTELAKLARAQGQRFDCAAWMQKPDRCRRERLSEKSRKN